MSGRRSLVQCVRSYHEVEVVITPASLASSPPMILKAFKLARPRTGSTYYIDLPQFFGWLKITGYGGEGSKWVYDNIPSWVNQLEASVGSYMSKHRYGVVSVLLVVE